MANDEGINVRVSVLEYRVDRLVEIVEEIRANYVTKAYLDEVVSRLATKEELKQLVTKDELQQEMQRIRNWIVGLFFTLFFSLAGLQFAMFQLYRHAS